ncbi:hypothetical protein [Roseiconus lacunae]|uniref:hypothetical protein n=1 Tax=Roseiconus lacunae TaxID=2605694 RepID=UPI0011F24718|nr:hypothetical protein [Roseiconus lacunae]
MTSKTEDSARFLKWTINRQSSVMATVLSLRQHHMSAYKFETPYPSRVKSVQITQYPRVAVITFEHGDTIYELRCADPRPVTAVVAALDDCYQFRIMDIGGQLEFGRYRVEVWDEDNDFAEFTVDSFEQIPIDTA